MAETWGELSSKGEQFCPLGRGSEEVCLECTSALHMQTEGLPWSSVFTLFLLSKGPELGSLFIPLILTTPSSFHYLHLLLLKCLQGPGYAVNTIEVSIKSKK